MDSILGCHLLRTHRAGDDSVGGEFLPYADEHFV
jgi:hypothetical protein